MPLTLLGCGHTLQTSVTRQQDQGGMTKGSVGLDAPCEMGHMQGLAHLCENLNSYHTL